MKYSLFITNSGCKVLEPKELSWCHAAFTFHILICFALTCSLRCNNSKLTTGHSHKSLFREPGEVTIWPRSYPPGMATSRHRLLQSDLCLSAFIHVVTTSRDNTLAGLDWLGTLSSHTWHKQDSSTWKIIRRRSLHWSLFDHVLRKLPRTDSLSVNTTTRLLVITEFQRTSAVNSANISS